MVDTPLICCDHGPHGVQYRQPNTSDQQFQVYLSEERENSKYPLLTMQDGNLIKLDLFYYPPPARKSQRISVYMCLV